MQEIVVGVDGSEGSRHALRWAAREARQWGASLRVLSMWNYDSLATGVSYGALPPADELQAIQQKACMQILEDEGLGGAQDIDITVEVMEGQARPALVDEAKDADLLVIGARGLGGFMGLLLGSVSQHCAAHASCPVVIVHPPKDS